MKEGKVCTLGIRHLLEHGFILVFEVIKGFGVRVCTVLVAQRKLFMLVHGQSGYSLVVEEGLLSGIDGRV